MGMMPRLLLHHNIMIQFTVIPENDHRKEFASIVSQVTWWFVWCGLTLSVRVRSHWLLSSRSLAMCVWPLSDANISAVVPWLSWMLASAPQLSSRRTITTRPCLTAKCRAVWPVCVERERVWGPDQELFKSPLSSSAFILYLLVVSVLLTSVL